METITNKVQAYMNLQNSVTLLGECNTSDMILDIMDALFYELNEEEIAYLDKRVFMCGSDD